MRTEADIARIVREVLDDLGKGTQYGEAQHENVQHGAVQHENVRRSGAHPKAAGGTARFAGEASARLSHAGADITLEAAETLMKRVEAQAIEMGMRVVTAVADSHGNPVAVRCMDGAYAGSFDVALNKTYTAAAFQMSTEELGTLSAPDRPLYGIQYTNQGRIVIFGGGIPLWADGQLIGSFGVSGGTAEQDTALAHFAEQVFAEMAGGSRKG